MFTPSPPIIWYFSLSSFRLLRRFLFCQLPGDTLIVHDQQTREMPGLLTPDEAAASHADLVRIPSIVFFAVTPIFVAIRFWNRIYRRTGLGWDDYTVLVSFVWIFRHSSVLW